MTLEQMRAKLGVRCLSIMQHDGHCTVFLHWPNESECNTGTADTFGKAVVKALQERDRELQARGVVPIKRADERY